MNRLAIVFLVFLLVGCVSSITKPYLGFSRSGKINSYEGSAIRSRQLDLVNALRLENGLSPVVNSRELNASAKTHAIDIGNQGRAWNFGSDLSSPDDRSDLAGFLGTVRGENVAETFEGEFEVLQVWLDHTVSRRIILDPYATHLGLGWFQQENGTIWWVQVFGQRIVYE